MKTQDLFNVANDQGKEVIAIKPYSTHPGDTHLYVVLCKVESMDPYVTWTCNTNSSDFFDGHYHRQLGEALEDFKHRGGPRLLS